MCIGDWTMKSFKCRLKEENFKGLKSPMNIIFIILRYEFRESLFGIEKLKGLQERVQKCLTHLAPNGFDTNAPKRNAQMLGTHLIEVQRLLESSVGCTDCGNESIILWKILHFKKDRSAVTGRRSNDGTIF